jgi:hypothetical protein
MTRTNLAWILTATLFAGTSTVTGCGSGSGSESDFEIDNGF